VRSWKSTAGSGFWRWGTSSPHYLPVEHEILDKFERGPAIQNEDVAAFRSPTPYDLIVSISTLEHGGGTRSPKIPKRSSGRSTTSRASSRRGGGWSSPCRSATTRTWTRSWRGTPSPSPVALLEAPGVVHLGGGRLGGDRGSALRPRLAGGAGAGRGGHRAARRRVRQIASIRSAIESQS